MVSNKQSGLIGGFLWLLFLLMLAALMIYAANLNSTIVHKFENRRWDIPARVYSRPLLLSQGGDVSKDDLQTWLKLLHYTDSPDATNGQTGTYHAQGNTYTITTRNFAYGDGEESTSQTIEVRFKNGRIGSLKSTKPSDKGFARLEPIAIGSIYPDSNEDRQLVNICQGNARDDGSICPIKPQLQPLIDALIATEDRGFYRHHGLSIRGTARAFLNNFQGKSTQGGSTLTQQLVKNFYLNAERSFKRKANEAIMALLLDAQYSKTAILNAYINEINLGQNGNQSINGFGIAAQFYFNKPLSELSLAQSAMLVGITKGPSYYNPRKYPERALDRRNLVLQNLLQMGKISQDTYDEAAAEALGVVKNPAIARPQFPDFLDYVRRELAAHYKPDDLKNAGLRIISTLDPIAQRAAEAAFHKQITILKKRSKHTRNLQGALISADPATGEVVTLVGSEGEFTGFNRAIDAKRQVGSLLKPIIYLMALDSRQYNLASGVIDEPRTYNQWTPKNYDSNSHGVVPLTTALANSYNQAAVNTGMSIGIAHFINYLKLLGINDNIPAYPSALLGAVDLSPMQVLGIYQVFASGGIYAPPHAILSVIDEQGRLLQKSHIQPERRLPADSVYLTNYAMQQVVSNGTAKAAAKLGNNLAGKTGTTNDAKDSWFAGYSGNYVSVVWVGRDDNKPIGLTGGSGALPIWVDFMRRLKLRPANFDASSKIQWTWLEKGTGRAADESCPDAVYLPAYPDSISTEPSHCAIAAEEAALQEALLQESLLQEAENSGAAFDGSLPPNENTDQPSGGGFFDNFFNF